MISLLFYPFKVVKAETPVVGESYEQFFNQNLRPINVDFGVATRETYDISTYIDLPTSNNIFDKKIQSYPDLCYTVFKFSNFVSIPLHQENLMYAKMGNTINDEITYTYTLGRSYEEYASISLAANYGTNGNLIVDDVDYGEIGVSINASVNTSVTASVRQETSITSTFSRSISVNFTADENFYYRLEDRGLFDAYVVQVYQANYVEWNKTHVGLPGILGHDEWENKVVNYTLKEQYVKYYYRPNTLLKGYFVYKYQNGKYVYDDIKEDGVFYL